MKTDSLKDVCFHQTMVAEKSLHIKSSSHGVVGIVPWSDCSATPPNNKDAVASGRDMATAERVAKEFLEMPEPRAVPIDKDMFNGIEFVA